MGTPLPSNAVLATRPSTHGAVRTGLGAIRDNIAGLFGADGEKATALATVGAALAQFEARAAETTLTTDDRGKVLSCSGTWALTLPVAATAGAGWSVHLRNAGTGAITVTRAGSDAIDGAATWVLPAGWAAHLMSTGSAWAVIPLPAAAATGTTAGLMAAADKSHLDEIYATALRAAAALTPAADRAVYFTGASTAALMTVTAAGRALLDDADAAAMRATLGLSAAVLLPGINGVVAMDAAGVATGAVLEEGVNKNGRWVKFASGWMICTRDAMVLGRCATANGSAFSGASSTWTFPVAFSAPPVVSGSASDVDVEISSAAPSTTSVAVRAQSATSKAVILTGQLSAIGRWGTVGAASPASPAGLRFWYDASDPATLWQDTAATVPVTQPGDPVGRINDKSGNGYHLVQATSTKRPLWQVDGDGHGYLAFDGTDDALSCAAVDFASSTAITVLAAVSRTSTALAGSVAEMSANYSSNPGTWRLNGAAGADAWAAWSNGTAVASVTPGGLGLGVVTLLSFVASISAPLLSARRNGAEVAAVTTTQGGGTFTSQTLYVGARNGTNFPLAGRIYGLIAYANILSAADLKAVEDWLNQRSGAF